MSSTRERMILAACGIKGTGKSSLIRCLISQARARGDVARILDPSANMGGEWPGRNNVDAWLATIMDANEKAIRGKKRRPTQLVVFDDAERCIPKHPSKNSPFVDLYSGNRHLDLDVLITCRRPQALPPELLSGADWLYLFAISAADRTGLERAQEVLHGGTMPINKFHFLMVSPLSGEKYYGRTRIEGSREAYEIQANPYAGHT